MRPEARPATRRNRGEAKSALKHEAMGAFKPGAWVIVNTASKDGRPNDAPIKAFGRWSVVSLPTKSRRVGAGRGRRGVNENNVPDGLVGAPGAIFNRLDSINDGAGPRVFDGQCAHGVLLSHLITSDLFYRTADGV